MVPVRRPPRRRRRAVAPAGRPATKGELDQLLEHLVSELDAADFFRTADRRQSMARALRLIFARAGLHEPDVHLLRGVIKQLAQRRPSPRTALSASRERGFPRRALCYDRRREREQEP